VSIPEITVYLKHPRDKQSGLIRSGPDHDNGLLLLLSSNDFLNSITIQPVTMKKIFIIITSLCLMACAVMPASAFTMKSLNIAIEENGEAQVDMNYDLSFVEQSAVFFRLADPAAQLKSAFDTGGSQHVTVTQVTSSSAHIVIPAFASVRTTDEKSTITTPSVSFERARDVLNTYWFAPLVSPDFSPAVTTITFPDGYLVNYYDQISIPPISHQLS
jgi:preprotein translocase subunit SecF